MRKILYSLLLLTSFPGFCCISSSALAASIITNFDVTLDSGSLNGNTFSGSFGFENLDLTGMGSEQAELSDFEFVFDGDSFLLPDALNPTPTVEFINGEITGLFYTNNRFSFEIDFFGDQFFSYVGDISAGGDGFGTVDFSDVPPIPSPTLLPGLLVTSLAWLRKRNGKSLQSD